MVSSEATVRRKLASSNFGSAELTEENAQAWCGCRAQDHSIQRPENHEIGENNEWKNTIFFVFSMEKPLKIPLVFSKDRFGLRNMGF